MKLLPTALAGAVAALAALTPAATSQTLLTLEGTFPSAGEFSMHPPSFCNFPNPGAFVWFMTDFAFPCATVGTFNPPPVGTEGDVAIDTVNDVIWGTDGLQLTGYQQGLVIASATILPGTVLPSGPITGLGFDAPNQLLWLTDGTDAVAVTGLGAGCFGPLTVVHGPFSVVHPSTNATVLDIEWDSWSNSLWTCDAAGTIANWTNTGAAGSFAPITASACLLGTPLTGIAFDTSRGTLAVTDGVGMEHMHRDGTPAGPTFYAPNSPCTTPPPPGPPALLSGLDYSPRPQRLGTACTSPVHPMPPTIGWTGGLSTSPNPAFGITLADAPPNSLAYLVLGVGAACPFATFGMCEIYPSPIFLLLPTTTDVNGEASFALPISALPPPGPPIGVTVTAQWAVQPAQGRQTTEGLSFTLSTH